MRRSTELWYLRNSLHQFSLTVKMWNQDPERIVLAAQAEYKAGGSLLDNPFKRWQETFHSQTLRNLWETAYKIAELEDMST